MILKTSYEAPSNIALVKYWGKYGLQMPKNPSISFTLQECKSIFDVKVTEKKDSEIKIDLEFEGIKNEKFAAKIKTFFSKIDTEYPILKELDWEIKSQNTFPHSSGIASSASSMAALAMCIDEIQHSKVSIDRASAIARIGSGSASRSVIPKLAWWGKNPYFAGSSNEKAIACWEDVDPIFHDYQNTILIASSSEKSVSSSLGHELMNTNTFAKERFKIANENCLEIYGAMREGDLDKFGKIVEQEALMLHALMMMSTPSFILIKPATLTLIDKIRQYRADTKLPVYFTLDAGPNIHLLYPKNFKKEVETYIDTELKPLCENNFLIKDCVGNGPKKL